jgi:hypothetical protein
VRWVLLVLGLEFPAILALIDCANRPIEHFAGGADDKRAWVWWLLVAVATAWFGVGDGIVLGYYYAVVKRNTPAGHRHSHRH